MSFEISDPETVALVRELARRAGVDLTEAVKLAVRNELRAQADTRPLRDRLRDIAKPIVACPDTGAPLDKAFFDELSGS
jgi:antitoxin VapB